MMKMRIIMMELMMMIIWMVAVQAEQAEQAEQAVQAVQSVQAVQAVIIWHFWDRNLPETQLGECHPGAFAKYKSLSSSYARKWEYTII